MLIGNVSSFWRLSVKVGDLVKYVGSCAMYRDRFGIVTQLYGLFDERIDSALVHYPGFEGKGRDAPNPGHVCDGLHPMSLDELKVFTPENSCL